MLEKSHFFWFCLKLRIPSHFVKYKPSISTLNGLNNLSISRLKSERNFSPFKHWETRSLGSEVRSIIMFRMVLLKTMGTKFVLNFCATLVPHHRVSHSGDMGGGYLPILLFFSNPSPPSKLMPPMRCLPHPLKNEAPPPIWKTNPPLRSEAPFQEMIPRKKLWKIKKLTLILVFQSQNNTGKRWQKFCNNVIFSIGAFKIL